VTVHNELLPYNVFGYTQSTICIVMKQLEKPQASYHKIKLSLYHFPNKTAFDCDIEYYHFVFNYKEIIKLITYIVTLTPNVSQYSIYCTLETTQSHGFSFISQ